MRVSGKKAAIVLASKPETWVAKSVNSLPMAAFYMPQPGKNKLIGEKSMAKQSSRFSTVLGTGALCAALAAAPLLNGLMSSPASAWSIQDNFTNLTANCTSEVLNSLGTKEQLNNLVVSSDNYVDANTSAQALPDFEKYVSVFRQYNNSLRVEWDNAGGETADTATQKAIAQKFVDAIKAAGFTIDENILNNFDASTSEKGALQEVYDGWLQAYPHLNDYMFLAIARGPFAEEPPFREMFLGVVCSAKNIDPNFEVVYATSKNPFDKKDEDANKPSTGDNTGDNKPTTPSQPTTPTQPTIIESSDKNVKVSGLNINVNYTLNVNLVPADDLKLTGDDFKNTLNQAFYDIFIRDDANNIISNTGKVEVSIKLPQGMNPKNDFVVYYVPTGANGEHLTDQAQAITGVKVSSDGWLTFETDHFSVYGIVEYTKGKAPNTGVVAQNETSATSAGAKIAAGVVTVLATLGATVVTRRQILRRKANNNQQ